MDPASTESISTKDDAPKPAPASGHQRFVLTDHVAFRYLEEDPSVTVLARRQKLEGYEVYLVEQWACSREHPTFIITTYTGDPKDSVVANVLSVPTDESTWSAELRVYFKALTKWHARPKETHLGTLMITNLSAFPSSLTVIPVPEGDVKKYRELFVVNEDLKRLGCSGRLGIKLATPSGATQAKFHQLYKTSEKIPLNSAVIELVKMCQIALVLFGILEPEYADGLLCDVTEKAINDWWVEFGADHYAVEPHDGILGPTTVAALLGMLIGARNRLSACNAPVQKDVFDLESTKRGIAYFQKSQRLTKTRRLDRVTLERLRRATAKAASGEGWAMPRALKSTVAELGGKGGEMVMGMVGARDKAGIAEIETVDIDRFVDLVQGERAKWLWYAKPRKNATAAMFNRLPVEEGLVPSEERRHSLKPLKKELTLDNISPSKHENATEDDKGTSDHGGRDGMEKDTGSKRAALKRATGKIEAVVSRRTHQSKSSRDENELSVTQPNKSEQGSGTSSKNSKGAESISSTKQNQGVQSLDSTLDSSVRNQDQWKPAVDPTFTKVLTQTPPVSDINITQEKSTQYFPPNSTAPEPEESSKSATRENSVAGLSYQAHDLPNLLPQDDLQSIGPLLRRTQSTDSLTPYNPKPRNPNWWPRHLSFSIAEDSILTFPQLLALEPTDTNLPLTSPEAELSKLHALSTEAQRLRSSLANIHMTDATWTNTAITEITSLSNQATADLAELSDLYYNRLDAYEVLREDAHEVVSRERAQLLDAVRDLETLGAKLEYEIGTLRGKVDDVEDGVGELERQVLFVEGRVEELEREGFGKERWGGWGGRVLFGFGGGRT